MVLTAHAVGGIAATEVVKEATKDAYKGMKAKIGEIWGKGGERAVAKVEADPASAEALEHLKATIAVVPAEDEPEVVEKYERLLSALADDEAARMTADRVATIRLDLDSGGHVRVHSLKNARIVDVKARAAGDIDLNNVDMDPGGTLGN